MMLRQRLRTRVSNLALIGRIVVLIFALALIWFGLMVVLLAAKVAPTTVNDISGYRTTFDALSGLAPGDVGDGLTRAIVAGAGLLVFVLCAWLAFKELPRPYLARHDLELQETERGLLTVNARAVERVAEMAACETPGVSSASGRYGSSDLEVGVSVSRCERTVDDATRRTGSRRSRAGHARPSTRPRPCEPRRFRPTNAKGAQMSTKYFSALIGFAFVAAWIGFSFGGALLCILGAAAFYAGAAMLAGEIDLGELQGRVQRAQQPAPHSYVPPPPPRSVAPRVR